MRKDSMKTLFAVRTSSESSNVNWKKHCKSPGLSAPCFTGVRFVREASVQRAVFFFITISVRRVSALVQTVVKNTLKPAKTHNKICAEKVLLCVSGLQPFFNNKIKSSALNWCFGNDFFEGDWTLSVLCESNLHCKRWIC